MESTTLVAPDISCMHCQQTIERGLSEVEGVSGVHVDIASKSVQVNYDAAKVNQDKLEIALDELGYTVAK